MKIIAKIVWMVSVACAFLWLPAVSDASPLGEMRVRLAEGDVQVKISETGDWVPVAANTPLLEGDEIWVPDGGRAALQMSNGTYIRLDGGTAFQLLRMDRGSCQFHVAEGYVYVLNRSPERTVLQFDTSDASIRSFGQSAFRIDIQGGETGISVTDGSVIVESDDGTTRVRAGDMLALGPGGLYELSPLPRPDEWQVWNERRDRAILAGRGSDRHLPEELQVYSDDFEANGRWLNVGDYGYVWTPTVVVVADWAPYRHGRWVWRGGDYVWIGYEPWGWAPYHYGRWAFEARIGWFWVPPERGDVHWGPGYVGWVRTPDHVAWVPLAPREVYYGRGDYGRNSVNITNMNIRQVRVTNVYRNVNVVNSITIVQQATFVTGRPAPVHGTVVSSVREDFTRQRNIEIGSPRIKPAETSYVPVVRSIPEAKRPPERIRNIEVKQLQKARPLVKEADRSVIRADEKSREMPVRKVETPRPVQERAKARQPRQPAAIPGEKPSAESAPRGGSRNGNERGGAPVAAPPADRAKPEQVLPQATPPADPKDRPKAVKAQSERSKAAEKAKKKKKAIEREKAEEIEKERERGGEGRYRR